MSNSTDKVNARNLENLHIVNSIVEMIPGYQPSSELIAKTALLEFERDFAIILETLHEKITIESNATVAQTEAFETVGRMATRISSAAKASGLSAEAELRLDRLVRLIRGRARRDAAVHEMAPSLAPAGIGSVPGIGSVAAVPAAPNGNGDGGRVQSHTTKAAILSTLDTIHEQILSMPNYRPNEADLSPERIGEWLAGLRQARNARLEARASTENTRQERDDFLVGPEGLGVRMRMVKMYINSILDPNDDRRRRIRGLKFVFRAK